MLTTIIVITAILFLVVLSKISQIDALYYELKNGEAIREAETLAAEEAKPAPPVEEMLAHEVAIPVEGGDYHGHPNYLYVWGGLLALFGISLLGDFIDSKTAMVLLIFGTALIKALMVMIKFMHLQFEPKIIAIFCFAVFFCLFAFFWGVYPDIVMETLDLAKK